MYDLPLIHDKERSAVISKHGSRQEDAADSEFSVLIG